MKSHFTLGTKPLCGRGKVVTDKVREVTCLFCQSRAEFAAAKDIDARRRAEAFDAQVPRLVREPWVFPEVRHIVCRNCDHHYFREGERSCYGHYANYVCASCGHTESRLTETGMSF